MPKTKNNKPQADDTPEQEFFRIPRAEFLIEELQNNRNRQIGDLVTNTSRNIANRFTLKAEDNCMDGAGIREGDHMVIEKKSNYTEGSILAVQLGNNKLVRRYFRAGDRIPYPSRSLS
jgi:SOS-response transcriptional repressor LexA